MKVEKKAAGKAGALSILSRAAAMNLNSAIPFSFATALFLGVSACSNMEFTHVKPGQSARAALTARNAPAAVPVDVSVEGGLPTPAEPTPASAAPATGPVGPIEPLPAPGLPDPSNTGEKVAELYTRGSIAMQAGQNADAIAALEQIVELDPNFSDAWSKLVILYQQEGQNAKAMAAYKKAKKLGQPNGPTNLAPIPGNGLLP
jgi:hypothetical protein